MPRCKVALFHIVNNVMDIDECEQVYIHMSRRERFKCYRFVKFYFDFILPLNEYSDLFTFYWCGVQIIICFRLPFLPYPIQRAYVFINVSWWYYPIIFHLEHSTPEQAAGLRTLLCESGYTGDFVVHAF